MLGPGAGPTRWQRQWTSCGARAAVVLAEVRWQQRKKSALAPKQFNNNSNNKSSNNEHEDKEEAATAPIILKVR